MHAIRCGLPGKAFATAAVNDSGGRKSRIRRSKEERKAMVESFIKKYQDSNNGSFPSLNLAHKEVGGSFYMVREIVREIIQENRILSPPKVSINENVHSEILHPLGSISVEPPYRLTESESVDMDTHLVPDGYQVMGKENTARSIIQFHETNPRSSSDQQILEGHNKKISNGVVLPELNQHFDRQEVASYENDEIVEDGERNEEEAILKVLNAEKLRGKHVERLQAVTSHVDSDVVVEKFPLRPITKMEGESSKLQRESARLGDDTIVHAESSFDLANVKDETKELSKRHKDEKVVQNLQADDCVNKKSNPTLDRINLDTWERSADRTERNPFLALVKALVTAFTKLWSE